MQNTALVPYVKVKCLQHLLFSDEQSVFSLRTVQHRESFEQDFDGNLQVHKVNIHYNV